VHGPDGSVTQVLAVDRWKTDLADETSARDVLTKINLLNGINRHDILNQATTIASYPGMIESAGDDPRNRERCLRIRKAVDTICERVNASRFSLDIVPREIRWQEVAAVLAPMKVPDRIRLEVVPPLPVVFSSIIRYVGKYSGGVSRVRVSAEETPDGCAIRIEDNGTGIPEEEERRIFNHSYSDHHDFDLCTTQQILSETRIGIPENGTPGKGTRFGITVPKGWYQSAPSLHSPESLRQQPVGKQSEMRSPRSSPLSSVPPPGP
jgi:hypothetical protein